MSSSAKLEAAGPRPLSAVAVDLSTRLGAVAPVTPVGLPTLENLLAGGLRAGDFLVIAGPSGIGKSALALFFGYLAARSRAAALIVGASLSEDEVLARFAARALFRESPKKAVPYGEIWSGRAWQDDEKVPGVRAGVETVVKKVGAKLHVRPVEPFTSVETVGRYAAALWSKHDRVVAVVDDLGSFVVSHERDQPTGVAAVAYALRRLAGSGCAVVATVQPGEAEAVAPAATLVAELRPSPESTVGRIEPHLVALGARNVDLVVTKNRIGPTGVIPLRFVAGVATFEERAP